MQNISTRENVSIMIRQYFSDVYFDHCSFNLTAMQRECAHLSSSVAQINKTNKKKKQFSLIFF